MTLARIIILTVVIALGTLLVSWWVVPLLGVVYGVLSRNTRHPGLVAAAAGALAWGGYLVVLGLRRDELGAFAVKVAAAMSLPAPVPLIVTIVFPALLAGLASYVGARFRRVPDSPGRVG